MSVEEDILGRQDGASIASRYVGHLFSADFRSRLLRESAHIRRKTLPLALVLTLALALALALEVVRVLEISKWT